MEDLVDIVNQLQDVFTAGDSSGIDLPQIVVVGSQSAGKSSVLEHIVGRSFLPRGTGIVTRCPLVLQLLQVPMNAEEYAVFQHDSTKIFRDYSLVTKEIEEQTLRLAGDNKGICSNSINLKIYSPAVLNLTLVDLPGLTKVPVGDQPWNIEDQTRDLILQFITNPNSIILAVTPANADMANSESLKIAREVDPEGKRTLAVLTKLDLMDEGTDAWDMLHGKIIPVKLGIVGVVNRSQKDIQDEKSIADSLKEEAAFFMTHYKSIAEYQGNKYLSKKVQDLLVNHIEACFPKLKERINEKLKIKKSELTGYAKSKLNKPALLLDFIRRFVQLFESIINGSTKNLEKKKLQGGARITKIFQEDFPEGLKGIVSLENLDDEEMETLINNSNGIAPVLFVPEAAFQMITRQKIDDFRKPSLSCIDSVYKELNKISNFCLQNKSLGLDRYPKLKTALGSLMNEFLQNNLPRTTESIENFIDFQIAHINNSHPDFESKHTEFIESFKESKEQRDSLEKVGNRILDIREVDLANYLDFESKSKQQRHSGKKVNLELIKDLIVSYLKIVQKIVHDTIPKIIIHFLVNFTLENLNSYLTLNLINKEEEILSELPKTVRMRNAIEQELESLVKAEKNSIKYQKKLMGVDKTCRRNTTIFYLSPFSEILALLSFTLKKLHVRIDT